MAGDAAAPQGTCELTISLKSGGSADIGFDPFGRVALRLPHPPEGRPPVKEAGGPGWTFEYGPEHKQGWVYRVCELSHPYAVAPKLVLSGLKAGKYTLDFLPGLKYQAEHTWVLPKPIEFELTDKADVTMTLQPMKPIRISGLVRVPKGAMRGPGKRGLFLLDVTAGHYCRLGQSAQTDEEGRFSLLLFPTRTYRLVTHLGMAPGPEQVTDQFAPEQYKERVFEWLLDRDSVATWHLDLVVEEKGQRAPYHEEAFVEIKGSKTGGTWTIYKGKRAISVFRGIEESFTYFVEGHEYKVALAGGKVAESFYIKGPSRFKIPEGASGEQVFELVLARKVEVRFRCLDAATDRPLPEFGLRLAAPGSEVEGYSFRHPAPAGYVPAKIEPGKWNLRGDAKGYKRTETTIEVADTPLQQSLDVKFSPLTGLRVVLKPPEKQPIAGAAWLYYVDGNRPTQASITRLQGETAATIPCDDGRPRVLRIEATGLAPVVLHVPKGQTEVSIDLSQGVIFEIDVQIGDERFGPKDRAGLMLVRRDPLLKFRPGFEPIPYAGARFREDGCASVRLLPGDYGVYLAAPKGWKWPYHLEDIKVEGELKKAYRFGNYDELRPKRVTDDLEPVKDK
ncbi:MAG: hypothetical protein FJ291_23120 [Planctomycetes bacterium]|nr:hypothetical protein [Planctomycetota bacterium]